MCKSHLKAIDLNILEITTASNEDWSVPTIPEPTGWDHPSAKPLYDQERLPTPEPYDSEEDGEYDEEEEEDDVKQGVKVSYSDDAWPSPPPSPKEGNDMHPPHRSMCGETPGSNWQYNEFGNLDYFRFLIPDPHFPGYQMVAPWIKYDMDPANPQISGSYGINYPSVTRSLRAIPVPYRTPTLAPGQNRVLRTGELFTDVIDYILEEHCPKDLVTSVHNYRYHDDARQALEAKIAALHEKAYYHLEKSVCAISDLENTNILGRLIAHAKDFDNNPRAYAAFFQAIGKFTGNVTYSGSNTQIDPSLSAHINLGPPASAVTVRNPITPPRPYVNLLKAIRKDDKYGPKTRKAKRCHKCRLYGHIRRDCPTGPIRRFRK